MNPDCIFCRIINHEAGGHVVHEDDSVIAFMDRNPSKPGHTLVVPRRHVPHFYDLDDDLYSNLMLVAKRLSLAVNSVIRPKRVGLVIVGFGVPHTHIHIMPLDHTDDIAAGTSLAPPLEAAPDNELAEVASRIRQSLADTGL